MSYLDDVLGPLSGTPPQPSGGYDHDPTSYLDSVLNAPEQPEQPEQPGWGSRAIDLVGQVADLPWQAENWLIKKSAALQGLPQNENTDFSEIAQSLAGYNPGEVHGYKDKLISKGIGLGARVFGDPTTYVLPALGRAAAAGKAGTAAIEAAARLSPEALGALSPAAAEAAASAVRLGRIADPAVKAAGYGFGALMTHGAYEGGKRAIDDYAKEGFSPDVAANLLDVGVSGLGAFHGFRHAYGDVRPLFGEPTAPGAAPASRFYDREANAFRDAPEPSASPEAAQAAESPIQEAPEPVVDPVAERLAQQGARAQADIEANGPAPGVGTPGAIPWETKTVLREPAVVEQPQSVEGLTKAQRGEARQVGLGIKDEFPRPTQDQLLERFSAHGDKAPEMVAEAFKADTKQTDGSLYFAEYENIPPPEGLFNEPPDSGTRIPQWTREVDPQGPFPKIVSWFLDEKGQPHSVGGVTKLPDGEGHYYAHGRSIGKHAADTVMDPIYKLRVAKGWKDPKPGSTSEAFDVSKALDRGRSPTEIVANADTIDGRGTPGERGSQLGAGSAGALPEAPLTGTDVSGDVREGPGLLREARPEVANDDAIEGRGDAGVTRSGSEERGLAGAVPESPESGAGVPEDTRGAPERLRGVGEPQPAPEALAGIPPHRQGIVGALIDKYESINNAGRTPSMPAFEQALRDNELTDAQIALVKAEVARRVGPEAPPVAEAAPVAEPSIRDKVKALGKPPAPAPQAPEPALTPRDPALVAPGVPEGSQAPPAPSPEPSEPKFSVQPNKLGFYSQLQRIAEKIPQAMKGSDLHKYLTDPKRGVKAEELKWTGLDDFLRSKAGERVTPQEVQDFLRENDVQVKEVTLSESSSPRLAEIERRQEELDDLYRRAGGAIPVGDRTPEQQAKLEELGAEGDRIGQEWERLKSGGGEAKFSQYQLPGGENYREVLLTLPKRDDSANATALRLFGRPYDEITAEQATQVIQAMRPENFHGGHFEEPNVLAHIRLNDRTDAAGKRVLFVEEIQSDWAQKGRREGFQEPMLKPAQVNGEWRTVGPDGQPIGNIRHATQEDAAHAIASVNRHMKTGPPPAPFVTSTEGWTNLALKRILRMAAEEGYDRVAWTTGEQQAARYDLSKVVEKIDYHKGKNGLYVLRIAQKGRDASLPEVVQRLSEKELADTVGKEMADKIIKQEGSEIPLPERQQKVMLEMEGDTPWRRFSGLDLKVGGEGMAGFYDKIVPDAMGKLGKKWGAKVGEARLPGTEQGITVGGRTMSEPARVHAIDITDSMRRSVVEEGQSQFSAGKPGAPKPPDRAVVRQKLEALFKGQKVEDTGGEGPNQPFIVRTPSGARVVVEPTGEIRFNEVSAEAHGPAVKAAMEQGAARAVGSMQSLGKDAWVKIVDAGELPHEIGGHVFLDHFASDRERAFVEKEWQKRSETEGKGRSFDEVFADDFNKWWTDRQSAPSTVLGKVFERIHDFFHKTATALGFQTREGLFREIESGKPFMREGVKPIPPGAKPGQALSAQVKTESPEFKRWFKDSKIVDERGKPKQVFHRGDFDENHNPIPEINGEGFHFGTKEAADQRPLGKMVDDNIRSLSYDKDENGNWHWDRSSDGLSSYDMGIEEGFGSKAEAQRHAERIASEEGDSSYGDDGEMPALTQAYISLKNPKRVADQAGDWTEAIRQAKAEGHDGLIYKNQFEDKGSTSYVVFKPEQIKSVNNRGTFDPNSPNVKFSTQPETNLPLLDRIKERIAEKRAEVDRDYGPGKVGDYALLRSALADETGRMAGAAVPPDQMGQYAAALGIEKPVRGQAAPKFSAQPVPAPGAPPEPPEAPKTKVTGFPKGSPEAAALEPESVGRPRVEAKVESMRLQEKAAGMDAQKLSRDKVRHWESLDPAVQKILRNTPDEKLLGKAARGDLSDVETMAVDARVRDLHERAQAAATALQKAKTLGNDEGPANMVVLENALHLSAMEAARAGRADVQGGSKIARALAARARIMEAGRSVPDQFIRKVFREIEGVTDEQAGDLLKILQSDPHLLPDALTKAMQPKLLSKFLFAWKNGLVSGFGTQIANISGNVAEQGVRLGETGVAAFVDKALGGTRTRFAGEAGAELKGGFSRLPGAFGDLARGIKDIVKLAPEKIDLKRSLDHQVNPIGGNLGRAVGIPFRLLGAFDNFFKAVGGDAELGKLAYRKAALELPGADAAKIRARAQEITKQALDLNSTEHQDVLESMATARQSRTFQGAPGPLAKGLMQLRANNPWLHAVLPFLQTPANIMDLTIERSPAGFLKAKRAYSAWKVAEKRGAEAATIAKLRGEAVDAIARPMLGTAILGGFAALAQGGLMTGSGPNDPKERNLLRGTGWQPYSFVLPGPDGKKRYVPFNRFEPVSSLLGFAADLAEIKDQKKGSDIVDKAIGSVLQNLTSKSYLSGLADAAALYKDPIGAGSQYVQGLVGSLVPTVVAKGAQALDPTIRDTTPSQKGLVGFGERLGKTLESRLPGLSQTLPARESATGEEIKRPGEGVLGAASRFILPVQVSTEVPEAELERTLVDLDMAPSQPSRDFTVPKSGGKKLRLNDEEYDLLQTGNKLASDRARRLVASPSWQRLDPEEQRRQLRLIYDRARDLQREKLLGNRDFRTRMREFQAQI